MPQGGRTPTAILKQTGGYRSELHADRLDTLPLSGNVRPIEGLDPEEQEIYDDLTECLPAGVLSAIDTTAVRLALEMHKTYRLAYKRVQRQPNNIQARRLMVDAFDRFLKIAGELGITPNARAAMKKPEVKEDDPFIGIFQRIAK